MKKLSIYILKALFSLLLLIVSCAKDNQEGEHELGEGFLRLSLNIGTRAEGQEQDILSSSILKIYQKSGEDLKLIRRYSPASDIPKNIYLVAGDYKVTVSIKDRSEANHASFDEVDQVFYGEKEFKVIAKEMVNVEVTCYMINSAVKVIYEYNDLFNSIFDGEITTHVSASDVFSEDDESPKLEYLDNNLTGYYLLPEGVSNLSWEFNGISSTLGNIVKRDVITSPKSATLYTLNFKYSKTPDGFLELNMTVDESAIEFDDDFIFSPQPVIQGSGLNEPSSFVSEDMEYNVISINNLSSIEISDATDASVIFRPLVAGVVVDLSADGIIYNKTDDKNGVISLNKVFFDKYSLGGLKNVKIVAIDESDGTGEATAKINVAGIIAPIVDFWGNSAILQALVTDVDVNEAMISYRESGDADWITLSATKGINGVFSASVTPTWAASQNEAGLDVKTLATGFSANRKYQYKLTIAGSEYPTLTLNSGGAQVIPYGDMEDGNLVCWGIDEGAAPNWVSSNNGLARGLCTFSTYAGMGGSHCAKLSVATPILVNLASGSLCLGTFNQSGTNGVVSFGQSFDWQSRPKTFKLKYAATIGNVTASYHDGAPIKIGDKDKARILFAIVDWSERHDVKSGIAAPSGIWDPATQKEVPEGKIIGYASKFVEESTVGDNMHTIELPIYYYDTNIKPSGKYTIVVSVSTNAYGDYLTGSKDNILYVDDFELGY